MKELRSMGNEKEVDIIYFLMKRLSIYLMRLCFAFACPQLCSTPSSLKVCNDTTVIGCPRPLKNENNFSPNVFLDDPSRFDTISIGRNAYYWMAASSRKFETLLHNTGKRLES